ncbi:hypothetical protein LIQ52_11515, partial [Mitsuokella jalaludinii]
IISQQRRRENTPDYLALTMKALFSSEVAVVTVCGLAALFVLVFLSLVVLASFDVIDGKFLLELIRAFRK